MSHARNSRRKARKRDPIGYMARGRGIRIERLAAKLLPLYGVNARAIATAAIIRTRPGGEGSE